MVIRDHSHHPLTAVYDVCAIGNAIVDIIADSEDDFLEHYGIIKGGMTLIDEARADYLYKNIGPAVEVSGGSVANTVAGIASLGGTPAYIGKVRNDQLGSIFTHDLQSAGVHYDTPMATHGAATARCLILVTPDAQRSMNTFLGVSTDLSSEEIDEKLIVHSQITFMEGYLFDKPQAQEAFYKAAKIAQGAGRKVALSLSDTFCVDRHREDFTAFVRDYVDILLCNEDELKSLYQTRELEAALEQGGAHCSIVACTRGVQGAVVLSGAQRLSVPAEKIEKVVDTTGAGDLFAAGFLFGLTNHCDLMTCAALGHITAGEVVSHYGPRPQCSLKKLVEGKGVKVHES